MLARWLTAARENRGRLLALLDAVHAHPVPEPAGAFDSLVEFDRRRLLKEQLSHTAIGTCLETELAVGALEGRCTATAASHPSAPRARPTPPRGARWPSAWRARSSAATRPPCGPCCRPS